MKNLFKNLMLVAVAAMAFTACEENQPETNVENKGEGTTYTIEVSLDDTRSAFGELDGDSFPSYWEGTENVEVFLYSDYPYYYDGANATLIVDEENSKTAKITFKLPQGYDYNAGGYVNAPSSGEFYVASPSDVVDINSFGWSVNWNNLKNQTPRENNVDANAHVVVAEHDGYIYSGMNLSFKHAVAYAKMSFTALPEGVENIDSVIVDFDGMTYTLDTSYTENIWFAVKESTPEKASVTIVSGDKKYKKELALNNKLSFVTGAVSAFKVNMSSADEIIEGEGDDDNAFEFPEGTHMWDTIAWNSSSDYVKLTHSDYSSYTYMRLYFNKDDANSSKIEAKKYTHDPDNKTGSYNLNVGEFTARVYKSSSDGVTFAVVDGYSDISDDTLEVVYKDGIYYILYFDGANYHGYAGAY